MSTIVEIRIAYEVETGKLMVFAPMNQKEVCYDILKLAKKKIKNFKPSPICKLSGPELKPAETKMGVLQ
jgi:hypothetical protein